MADWLTLPTDAGNAGIKTRMNPRTVAATLVHENVMLQVKDTSRTLFTAIATAVTGVTTEGLISLTPYRNLTAGGAATTHAVTANKILRLQQMVVTWRNNTAAAGGVTCRFRMLAGTVLVGSPVHLTVNATTSLATIGSGMTAEVDFPDGFELSGTMQFGVTQIAVGAVVGFDIQVIGFEYGT